MKKGMAKPFTIRVNSISAQPLSTEETAEKYGLPSHELRRLKSFVIRRDVSSGRLTRATSVTGQNNVISGRKSRGHR
jgi:hypothetical protein